MNEALEDNLTSNQDHHKKDFKVIKEDVDTVYLTENEIKVLYEIAAGNRINQCLPRRYPHARYYADHRSSDYMVFFKVYQGYEAGDG